MINISSMLGLAGIPSQSAYSATKFVVHGRSKALSYILEPFGIKVILIEPGVTNTKFVQDIVVPTNKYEDDKNGDQINPIDENNKDVQLSFYNDTMKKFLAFYFKAMSKVFHPRIVADEIIHSIELVYYELNTTNYRVLRLIVGNDSKNIHSLKNI